MDFESTGDGVRATGLGASASPGNCANSSFRWSRRTERGVRLAFMVNYLSLGLRSRKGRSLVGWNVRQRIRMQPEAGKYS
jgi:hypothetical protein